MVQIIVSLQKYKALKAKNKLLKQQNAALMKQIEELEKFVSFDFHDGAHPPCWASPEHTLECCWNEKNVAEMGGMLLKWEKCCWIE